MAAITFQISINKKDALQMVLKDWAKNYNNQDFIKSDPIQFPKKYTGRNAEISGFIISWLSFGNRKAIIKTAEWLDKVFCEDPYCWVMTKQYNFYYNDHRKFYRFLSYDDLYRLGNRLHRLYEDFERMEDMVVAWSDKTPVQALSAYFNGINGIPDYDKGSACKRLCMFLRWMVRNDGIVDMGIWKRISPTQLIIPLDTHVYKLALALGITKRTTPDMQAATEITDYFKAIFPTDPALGDFALFGAGISINEYK
ncbi:MAG: TIGR02757 family protein [Phocaeicola sp.]